MLAGPRRPQTDQAEHGRPHGDHDGEWQRDREKQQEQEPEKEQ